MELAKTKEMFERSLTSIQTIYERSQRLINKDYGDLELIAQEMKQQRNKIKIKHLTQLRSVEQEFIKVDSDYNCDNDARSYFTVSGRINIHRITN